MAQLTGKGNTEYKHGFATRGKRPALYWHWRHIIARCHEPKSKDYVRYGARGIHVCDRWHYGEDGISGFVLWMQDMGPKPFPNATVDRIKNELGYSPGNCRWASTHEQANNRRTNVRVTARGQTMTVAQWARVVGIGPKTIAYRLKQGATPEEAIFKKPNHGVKLTTLKEDHENTIPQPQTSRFTH